MNWRLGLFRLWAVASIIWAGYVVISRVQRLWWGVVADDFFGDQWLPWWASLTSYVQPYADPSLGMHPNAPGTKLIASGALIAARVGDTLIIAALPPVAFLLIGLGLVWIVKGFRRTSN